MQYTIFEILEYVFNETKVWLTFYSANSCVWDDLSQDKRCGVYTYWKLLKSSTL